MQVCLSMCDLLVDTKHWRVKVKPDWNDECFIEELLNLLEEETVVLKKFAIKGYHYLLISVEVDKNNYIKWLL